MIHRFQSTNAARPLCALLALLMVLPVAALEQVAAPEGRPVAGLLAQANSEIPPEILALEMKARNHNERSEPQQALALMQQVMAWVNANLPRNDPYRAQTQSIVGALLNAEGRHQEALGPTEEAIKIYSELAKTNPSLLGDLAMALNNLGMSYNEVGRHQEALAPTEEALKIYRELAKTNPSLLGDLAMALNNLGMSYSLLGRRQEALAPTEEAVKVYRDLVKTNPADLNNMAKTLSNLGMCYGLLDRHQEALAPTEEAVQIYRDLAKTNPVDLAMALNNLGLTQQELGKPKQARRSVAEAVAIIRQLAATNPAFQEFMQGMLKNLEIMN